MTDLERLRRAAREKIDTDAMTELVRIGKREGWRKVCWFDPDEGFGEHVCMPSHEATRWSQLAEHQIGHMRADDEDEGRECFYWLEPLE